MLRKPKTESSSSGAEAVVAALLKAFNAKDLNGFLACFAEHAEVWALGEDKPLLRGKKTLRTAYAHIFQSKPDQRVTVLSQIAHGGTVIQKERVEGNSPARESLVIYKVANERVSRLWVEGDA